LTGHSHSYERSFLLDGHYDDSSTLTEEMKPAGDTDGRVDGDGAYQKRTSGPAPHEGAVYVVAGSSGQISGGVLNHSAMVVSMSELGSMVLDVEGDRLEARFLDAGGAFLDHFTIVKNTGVPPQAEFSAFPIAGAAPLTVQFDDDASTNTASWDWDLDGDAVSDSSVRNPEITYTTAGMYTVELTVSNAAGTATETKPAYICVSEGVPAPVPNVTVAADAETISWGAVTATGYDLLQGDLNLLSSTGGDFTAAILTCLEDGDSDLSAIDPGTPPPGAGIFYLVRGTSLCDEPGTYESGGAGQTGSRDAEIQAASAACP
ncbi:MAG: PKD domain-containing protein, partial [Acidobacteria bacterium]|nr:PKD domain-containing protein [Acidobacteriota bacterium]